MSERFGIDTIKENVSDFGKELIHSAFVNPYNAVVQLADKAGGAKLEQIDMHGAENKDSLGAKVGALAGFVVDFAALSVATRGATKPLLTSMGVGESSAIANATNMGLSGGLYGGVFTPTEGGQDLLSSRLKQAGVQAGTFAAMSLATSAFGGANFEGSLTRRIGVNAAGGAVGGATNAILNERLINDRWASGTEIAQQAGGFALFGAAFAGVDYAIGKGVNMSRESRGVETYPAGVHEMLTPFKRLSEEPILGPRDGNKFDSAGAFNPTATRLPNGDVAILYRAQDLDGVSTVGYARTAPDGKTVLERSDEPVLAPKVENEKLGIEDPRLTVDTVNPAQYDLTATKWDGTNAQLADWTSTDLKNWQERGIMMPANEGTWNTQWTKSGSLVSREINGQMVPEKIDGKYWMFYMGSRNGVDELGLASSVDGVKWTDATNQPILPARPGQFDSNVVEPGPAAILTDNGINLIYSGGSPYEGNRGMFKYQTGLAVFDKNDPTRLLYRSSKPVFSPETPWEIENSSTTVHQVPNVVFPQGVVPDGKNGYLVYYGAADSYVGLAHTKFTPVNQFSGIADALRQSILRSPSSLNLEEKKEK